MTCRLLSCIIIYKNRRSGAAVNRLLDTHSLAHFPAASAPSAPSLRLLLEGKAKRRRLRRKKGSQPRLAALGSPFQGKGLVWTLPPSYGRRCPEGAEVGWGKRDEKERGRSSQAGNLRKYPSAAGAVPLPQWRRLRYENTASPITSKRIHAYVICEKRITTYKAFPLRVML